jgi:osmoprotectant transport system permease protein
VNGVWDWLSDGQNWQGDDGVLARLYEHLWLSGVSVLVALAIALPIAMWLGHIGKGGALAVNISNIGRAIPTFAVLVLLSVGLGPVGTAEFGPFGRAGFATLVALVLFAIPPIITNTYVGMREVDRDLVETARGMGMTGMQAFRSVELPLALPLIMTGFRLAVVQVWATATIAALVAGPGLGRIITKGFTSDNQPQVVSGAIIVGSVALALELGTVGLERMIDPVRRAKRRATSEKMHTIENSPANVGLG